MQDTYLQHEKTAFAEHYVGPRGHALFPGGFIKAMTAVGPWSPLAVRGQGWRLWDDTGRELADFHGNFTVNIHGNAHPDILSAVVSAASDGLTFGLMTRHEIGHAERLVARFPTLDQVRYTTSGSEATQLAVRIARGRTGKSRIVVVDGSYHGWSDAVVPTQGHRAERGVPRHTLADTLVVRFDDMDGLKDAVQGGDVAAILIDLLPNRLGMTPPSDGFLEAAMMLGRRFDVALIVDEVISFRLARGGLTNQRDFDADLVCLGKTIGGGLPAGAVIGKRAWMEALDPFRADALEHGGTLIANPVSMAAGVAALDLLDEAAYSRLDALGEGFRQALRGPLSALGWQTRGQGSLCRLLPSTARHAAEAADMHRRLWWALYERGVLATKHGVFALSSAMDANVTQDAAIAVIEAVEVIS